MQGRREMLTLMVLCSALLGHAQTPGPTSLQPIGFQPVYGSNAHSDYTSPSSQPGTI
jgi:hypothetical protein